MQAFDLQTSASVWRQPALYYRKAGTPVVVNDYVVVSDQLGYVHAMSQVDGSFTARHQVDSSAIMADMAVSDDVLYVLSQDGRLEALTVQ